MLLLTNLIPSKNTYLKVLLLCILLSASIPSWLANNSPDFNRLLQLAQQRYGDNGLQTIEQWRTIITSQTSSYQDQLTLVNQFFNHRILFKSDQDIWQEKDYWATPLQTLGRGQGDCEDFSIAKYMTLLSMGVPPEQLRLIYVKASIGGPNSRVTQAHMVVAYYPQLNSEPLILDNLINDILPAGQRTDLKPVYSFNSVGLWVGGADHAIINQPEQRLSRWRDVLIRMQNEGL
jgi:predicted transglutaminase-like cysteine proteinase